MGSSSFLQCCDIIQKNISWDDSGSTEKMKEQLGYQVAELNSICAWNNTSHHSPRKHIDGWWIDGVRRWRLPCLKSNAKNTYIIFMHTSYIYIWHNSGTDTIELRPRSTTYSINQNYVQPPAQHLEWLPIAGSEPHKWRRNLFDNK